MSANQSQNFNLITAANDDQIHSNIIRSGSAELEVGVFRSYYNQV